MDIDKLNKKRQLNVQEQNALEKQRIFQTAQSFRAGEPHVLWIGAALMQSGINPAQGILVRVSSTPCGGGEQSAYAQWITSESLFYAIEATITMNTYQLISIERFENTSSDTKISGHERGTGKSFGKLSLEVLNEFGIQS
jgi:hypothetical protein